MTTRDLPMTSICPSLTVSCHLQLANPLQPPSFCWCGAFPLLFWSLHPTDYTHLAGHLLQKCFICISLVAFICPLFGSHCSPFELVLQFLLFFSTELEHSDTLVFIFSPYDSECDAFVRVCASLRFLPWTIVNLMTMWEQSKGQCDAGGLSPLRRPSVHCYLFPPAAITRINSICYFLFSSKPGLAPDPSDSASDLPGRQDFSFVIFTNH